MKANLKIPLILFITLCISGLCQLLHQDFFAVLVMLIATISCLIIAFKNRRASGR